jgi:hypothetical protein
MDHFKLGIGNKHVKSIYSASFVVVASSAFPDLEAFSSQIVRKKYSTSDKANSNSPASRVFEQRKVILFGTYLIPKVTIRQSLRIGFSEELHYET